MSPGFVLFLRVIRNAGLWGLPFDGGPLDLAKATLIQAGSEGYDASGEGTLLVRLERRRKSSLVWVDRAGAMSPVPGSAAGMSRTWHCRRTAGALHLFKGSGPPPTWLCATSRPVSIHG